MTAAALQLVLQLQLAMGNFAWPFQAGVKNWRDKKEVNCFIFFPFSSSRQNNIEGRPVGSQIDTFILFGSFLTSKNRLLQANH